MPGKIYSDKHFKQQRGAAEAGDLLEQDTMAAGQATSEKREAERRFAGEHSENYPDSTAVLVKGADDD